MSSILFKEVVTVNGYRFSLISIMDPNHILKDL